MGTASFVATSPKPGAFSDTSWIERFLAVLGVVAVMAVPVFVAMLWQMRSDGSVVPALYSPASVPSPGVQQWNVPRSARWVARGFFAFMFVIAPFVAYAAIRAGIAETIFVGVWMAVIIMFFTGWLTRFADRLTLSADGILHVVGVAGHRTARDVPVHDIDRIRREGGFVTISLKRGSIMVPTQVDDLAGLIAELQHRNPLIRFEGPWLDRR